MENSQFEENFPKAYSPTHVEDKWRQFWDKFEVFKANSPTTKPVFSIVMPPPNITGALHMGHALVSTLQDCIVRYKRMCGFETLWLPGLDHAGISAQTVVERHLIATEGKRRTDYERDDFVARIWQWKEEFGSKILQQLKAIGTSCDWSRLRFTMDDQANVSVRTAFKKLYDKGLIYRGDYLVNWDPVTQTAIADDEVEYEEHQSFLWHIKYPIVDSDEFVVVATTRPETMLGDTAVAVAPKDERYKHLIGKKILLPLSNRSIEIIADDYVDSEFGTGVVKITPAHDPNDYQMALRHQLPMINIMTPDGKINEEGGAFTGLAMDKARVAVADALEKQGFLIKKEPHTHRVGHSYRSKAIIEPYLSKQWFIKMEPFRKKLRAIVEDKQVTIIPKQLEQTYFNWIDNLRDWCISRQLWWGHRIPIWYKTDNPEICICEANGIPDEVKKNPDQWQQDSDVLDTWFSSALWPFSTMGWPEKTPDFNTFYPNSLLITAHDILFFWVARMLFMGIAVTDQVPFPQTYMHGLIFGKSYWKNLEGGGIQYIVGKERDEYDKGKTLPKDVHSKWEKMSKSKGNIIDPLQVINEFGTDAMRMALCASATSSPQIDLDQRRFEEFKNFANKVWNGARFVFMNLDSNNDLPGLTSEDLSKGIDDSLLQLEDKWILSLLNATVKKVNHLITHYQFDAATQLAYDFFWKEFCANYVEIVKPHLFGKQGSAALRCNKQKILSVVLCQSIRLLHPMAPFITEELFSLLKNRFKDASVSSNDRYTTEMIKALSATCCAQSVYPQVILDSDINEKIEETFNLIQDVVYSIRNIRGEMKLSPGLRTDIYIIGQDSHWQTVKDNQDVIASLIPVNKIHCVEQAPTLAFAGSALVHGINLLVPLPEEMKEKEKLRLVKEQEKTLLNLNRTKDQLSNEEFCQKAPAQLITKLKEQLKECELKVIEIEKKLLDL
ncbi:MAG: valine--tRNA ligase [Parachlamydiales bacterium]|nr:valine--tRNA ligase [Parachlamydiales bacterium]